MSEANEDMVEFISKMREMLAPVPADVMFQFFNNEMYNIPNFSKMFLTRIRLDHQ